MMDGSWKQDNLNVYRSHSMLDRPQEMLRAGHGARMASCAIQMGLAGAPADGHPQRLDM